MLPPAGTRRRSGSTERAHPREDAAFLGSGLGQRTGLCTKTRACVTALGLRGACGEGATRSVHLLGVCVTHEHAVRPELADVARVSPGSQDVPLHKRTCRGDSVSDDQDVPRSTQGPRRKCAHQESSGEAAAWRSLGASTRGPQEDTCAVPKRQRPGPLLTADSTC